MKQSILCFLLVSFLFSSQGQVFSGVDLGVSTLGPNSINARNNFVNSLNGRGCPITTFNYENQMIGASDLTLEPGVTLTTTGASDSVVNAPIGSAAVFGFATSGTQFYQIDSTNPVTFNFSPPQTAFGSYFTGIQPIFGPLTITFHDSTTQTFSLDVGAGNEGGSMFWGFISSSPITSVSIQDTNDAYAFDDTIISLCPVCPGIQSSGRFFTVSNLNTQIPGSGPSTCQIGVPYSMAAILCQTCGGRLADVEFQDYFSPNLGSLTTGFQMCSDGTSIYQSYYINSYENNTYGGVPLDITYPAITASSASILRGVLCQFHF